MSEYWSCSFLQGIFPTQELNPGIPHCRWILYQLSYQGQLPMSTGFSTVVTKRDHKVAAFSHAQLFSPFGNIIFNFYWSSVDFRCVCFRRAGPWLRYTCVCIFFFSSHVCYDSVFSRFPWANSRIRNVSVNPSLLTSPFPSLFPLIIISWFPKSVSLFVNEFTGMKWWLSPVRGLSPWLRLVRSSLTPSMLLTEAFPPLFLMAECVPVCGWTRHSLFCQWMFWPRLCLGYYEECCPENRGARIISNHDFLWI